MVNSPARTPCNAPVSVMTGSATADPNGNHATTAKIAARQSHLIPDPTDFAPREGSARPVKVAS